MSCEELRIEVPGFIIAAKSFGNKNGKPILCLHGYLDNAASFDFLAPLLKEAHVVALDSPGTGLSSHYPKGVTPHWKNDAFLLQHVIRALGWKNFDIIAHSHGSLAAVVLANFGNYGVDKILFLDVMGPKVSFFENFIKNLRIDAEIFFSYEHTKQRVFLDHEQAIEDRMKVGPLSYAAAKALVDRGVVETKAGLMWSFDRRLKCMSSMLPHEDELRALLRAIEVPVCLIRAEDGLRYPDDVFLERSQQIRHFVTHMVAGGHHVHMEDPQPVAHIASGFLLS